MMIEQPCNTFTAETMWTQKRYGPTGKFYQTGIP